MDDNGADGYVSQCCFWDRAHISCSKTNFTSCCNQEIASRGKYLGYHISNNQAEYQGLINRLKYLVRKDFSCNILYIRGDAEIVIRQMEGQYNVNSPNIKPYYERAYDLLEQVDKYTYKFRHVYRDKNWEADELANEAIQNAY